MFECMFAQRVLPTKWGNNRLACSVIHAGQVHLYIFMESEM